MDFEKLKKVWQSAANTPAPAETEQLKTQFAGNLRRRRRKFIGFLTWVFSALSLVTGMVIYHLLVTHQTMLDTEWAIIPLLIIPWFFAIRFLWQFRRHNRDYAGYQNSIMDALRATLDENRLARSRAKRVGLIYLLSIPVLVLASYQLRQSGKMSGSEMASMLVVFGIALAIAGGWTAFQYYKKLLPQQAEVESLLRHYESEEGRK
jgi:peptidoglycan/LPS O-acetylase OafA/YrhL